MINVSKALLIASVAMGCGVVSAPSASADTMYVDSNGMLIMPSAQTVVETTLTQPVVLTQPAVIPAPTIIDTSLTQPVVIQQPVVIPSPIRDRSLLHLGLFPLLDFSLF